MEVVMLYVVYDKLAESISPIQELENDLVALRMYGKVVDKSLQEDFVLLELGNIVGFPPNIVPTTPSRVVCGSLRELSEVKL